MIRSSRSATPGGFFCVQTKKKHVRADFFEKLKKRKKKEEKQLEKNRKFSKMPLISMVV